VTAEIFHKLPGHETDKEKIMSLRKFVCHQAGMLSVVLAFALLAGKPAAGNTITAASGGPLVVDTPFGGGMPARGGKYNLDAFALDSVYNKPDEHQKRPEYGNPGVPTKQVPHPTLTDNETADEKGLFFDAYSLAKITYPASGQWTSSGSYASVCGSTSSPVPNCGTTKTTETASAKATVGDPWSFAPISSDLTFDNVVTFGAGLSLQALAASGDFSDASIEAEGSTDLDGLGKLWTFSWTTDSTHPGVSDLNFWSNPALGLNDAAITSGFELLLSENPSTGLSVLTQSFSFDYQLTIPANTTPQFSSAVTYEADGATGVPEPSSLALALLGTSLLIAGKARRFARSGQSMMVTEAGGEIKR
jgi:hypothetical protein